MPQYSFSMLASVTVSADSEDEALCKLREACEREDQDVPYGNVAVYLPATEALQATLEDTYPQE